MDQKGLGALWDKSISGMEWVGEGMNLNPQHAQGVFCEGLDLIALAKPGIKIAESAS